MFLQNLESYNSILDLDSQTVLNRSSSITVDGLYIVIDKSFIALYTEQGNLIFQLNDLKYKIDEYNSTKVEKSINNGKYCFLLYHKHKLVAKFEYTKEEPFNNISPFEYLDDEEFDLGLLLSNMINDPSRRKIFIENNNNEV